jgi:hypothetical protein
MLGLSLRIFALLLASTLAVHPDLALARDEAAIAGLVTRVENQAEIASLAGTSRAAFQGDTVRIRDELRTGAGARLEVTLQDDTVLTLGENARVLVDRYVFDPDQDFGETILQAARGAFRFAAGRIQGLAERKIVISTPYADIGVRGTEFWGGLLDGEYGVLLLEGVVAVSNQAGNVNLSAPGLGTDIPSPLDPPGPTRLWPAQKVERALATVAFP